MTRGRARQTGGSSFSAAIDYITREGQHERTGAPPLEVWTGGGIDDVDTASVAMDIRASRARSDSKSLYHLIVSWAPGEEPTLEQAQAALDTQFEHLGFQDLQYVAALANDGEGRCWHVHAVVNRVGEDGRAREIWGDHMRLHAAARETEIEQGWQRVESPTYGQARSEPERDFGHFTGRTPFREIVLEKAGAQLREIAADPAAGIERVTALEREHGIRFEPSRGADGEVRGWTIVGRERGEAVALSDVAPDLARRGPDGRTPFGERFADLAEREPEVRPMVERAEIAAGAVRELAREGGSWGDVHAAFEAVGLRYEPYGRGARVYDAEGPETLRPAAIDRTLRFGEMEKRFGSFESSEAIEQHAQALEAVRVAEGLVVGQRLVADPTPLIDRLVDHEATFTRRDVVRTVAAAIEDPEQQRAAVAAVLEQAIALPDDGGRAPRWTTQAVLDEERTLRTAAEGLASTPRGREIDRPASERLDDQQRAAYDYAIADDSSLKVITGVPGAGKTTLINDVAAAYAEAGYRVRGTAVSNAACEVLRSETALSVENTAKLVRSWKPDEQGQVRRGAALTDRDVLVIDEVSMLGSEQGARILEAAREAGATVIAIGDDRQFLSVSRGNALCEMSRAVGTDTVDLERTRRQREGWQREATEAVRRGDVREALDAYREHGCIVETTTQDEARRALATRWGELTAAGSEVGVNVATNAERLAVGALLRDEWRAQGRLSGPDVTLPTMDGPTPYAIGDCVVVRETVREAELFNGSLATVQGVDADGRLALQTADGRDVILDVEAHPAVQHAYAGTAYRAQGATHDHELTLATSTANNRGLTVGMTRHRETYGLFLSEEAVGGYEGLVTRGERLEQKIGALNIVDRAAEIVREHAAAIEAPAPSPARVDAAIEAPTPAASAVAEPARTVDDEPSTVNAAQIIEGIRARRAEREAQAQRAFDSAMKQEQAPSSGPAFETTPRSEPAPTQEPRPMSPALAASLERAAARRTAEQAPTSPAPAEHTPARPSPAVRATNPCVSKADREAEAERVALSALPPEEQERRTAILAEHARTVAASIERGYGPRPDPPTFEAPKPAQPAERSQSVQDALARAAARRAEREAAEHPKTGADPARGATMPDRTHITELLKERGYTREPGTPEPPQKTQRERVEELLAARANQRDPNAPEPLEETQRERVEGLLAAKRGRESGGPAPDGETPDPLNAMSDQDRDAMREMRERDARAREQDRGLGF